LFKVKKATHAGRLVGWIIQCSLSERLLSDARCRRPRARLTAFELALPEADIEQQNIVTISSTMPPNCVELEREKGLATLLPGEG